MHEKLPFCPLFHIYIVWVVFGWFHTNSNSLNLKLSRFHTEFQLSQALDSYFFNFQTIPRLKMASSNNPTTTSNNPTIESCVGGNSEVLQIIDHKRNKEIWEHYDLCLMSNNSKKARCKYCHRFFSTGSEHDVEGPHHESMQGTKCTIGPDSSAYYPARWCFRLRQRRTTRRIHKVCD